MHRLFLTALLLVVTSLSTSCKSGYCTVSEDADGNATITCPDGSTATVEGGSCTATDNGDGTHTIACDDGTTVIVADGTNGTDGDDGTACTVTDNGNGTSTIACDDGTSVTFIPGCDVEVQDFDTYRAAISTCPGDQESSLVVLTSMGLAEPMPDVHLGFAHVCGLRPEGRAVCWGDNTYGITSPAPGPFVQVATSPLSGQACGLQADGAAVCWGRNSLGEGKGDPGPFVQLAGGYFVTCGLSPLGAVTCWGSDIGAPPEAVLVSIVVGYFYGCGLDAAGNARCWGGLNRPPDLEGPFVQLTAGQDTLCGLRPDGSVACSGDDEYGQASPPADHFARIDLAGATGCGIHSDGTLACWGRDDYGQATPPAGSFSRMDVGGITGAALRADLTVAGWGADPPSPVFPFTCPAGAATPSNAQPGLAWMRYNGTWTAIPDFSLLTPVGSGSILNVGIPSIVTGDNFGLVLRGWLNIPTTGPHDLSLTSDDGSRLSRVAAAPNGGIVVDHDGNHSASEKSASVCLGAGWHEIRIDYYEASAGQELSAKLDGAAIPASSLVYVP